MDHTDPLTRDLAGVVRDALADAGLSLDAASLATGIPKTTLHRRVNAISPFLITELASLATLTGTTAVDFMKKAQTRSTASNPRTAPPARVAGTVNPATYPQVSSILPAERSAS